MDNILFQAKEVIKLYKEEQVNKYLEKGWKLVYVGQHTDPPYIWETEFILIRTQ